MSALVERKEDEKVVVYCCRTKAEVDEEHADPLFPLLVMLSFDDGPTGAAPCARCGVELVFAAGMVEKVKDLHPDKPLEMRCEPCAAPLISAQSDKDLDKARDVARPFAGQLADLVTNEDLRSSFAKKARH